jgi:hypothetical protein
MDHAAGPPAHAGARPADEQRTIADAIAKACQEENAAQEGTHHDFCCRRVSIAD